MLELPKHVTSINMAKVAKISPYIQRNRKGTGNYDLTSILGNIVEQFIKQSIYKNCENTWAIIRSWHGFVKIN